MRFVVDSAVVLCLGGSTRPAVCRLVRVGLGGRFSFGPSETLVCGSMWRPRTSITTVWSSRNVPGRVALSLVQSQVPGPVATSLVQSHRLWSNRIDPGPVATSLVQSHRLWSSRNVPGPIASHWSSPIDPGPVATSLIQSHRLWSNRIVAGPVAKVPGPVASSLAQSHCPLSSCNVPGPVATFLVQLQRLWSNRIVPGPVPSSLVQSQRPRVSTVVQRHRRS